MEKCAGLARSVIDKRDAVGGPCHDTGEKTVLLPQTADLTCSRYLASWRLTFRGTTVDGAHGQRRGWKYDPFLQQLEDKK